MHIHVSIQPGGAPGLVDAHAYMCIYAHIYIQLVYAAGVGPQPRGCACEYTHMYVSM